jgi:hypothetical protein
VRTRARALLRVLPGVLFLLLLSVGPAAAGTPDPIDRTQPPAPDGTPLCAKWLHDRHVVRAGGREWPTWHPPYDFRHRCAYGHEHGSNPRAFRFFGRSGMPAFGQASAFAGGEEPHPGFKVFVANDDLKGLAWMIVLHQGSGSPRRGEVRFHSLETWLFRHRGRRLLAHTRHMADFGGAVPNCPGARTGGEGRLLPHPACGPAYERWDTRLDVGGALAGRPGFAIGNAITQFDPLDPGAVVFNKGSACGSGDPAGWGSRCKVDRRTVLHPRWVVRNRGRARFRTDAYGRRSPTGIGQFVSAALRVDQSRERSGVENAFVMERPSDGGLYRAGRGFRSAGFEYPGYCVLRSN